MDLQTHSTYSDGTDTPEELIAKAAARRGRVVVGLWPLQAAVIVDRRTALDAPCMSYQHLDRLSLTVPYYANT